MATEEDLKKAGAHAEETSEREPSAPPPAAPEGALVKAEADADEAPEYAPDDEDDGGGPIQLGYQRYVYATYMAGALLSAFLVAKIGHSVWYRLGQWKPELGEPRDDVVFPVAGVIGVVIALYYWRKVEARQYVNEVAEELSKVTWPTRKEVTSSTTVVVLTTLFATVFFALMDRFWGFITDKIYTF
jgi:preprotein translocase subunit SecE